MGDGYEKTKGASGFQRFTETIVGKICGNLDIPVGTLLHKGNEKVKGGSNLFYINKGTACGPTEPGPVSFHLTHERVETAFNTDNDSYHSKPKQKEGNMLYEVVVIKRQTVKEKENEEPEKILDPLQMIVARDREAAKFKAIIMGGYEIDEVEVIVLRFEGN